jgi:hypothetical protein
VVAKTPLKKTVAKIALASLRYEMQNGFFFSFCVCITMGRQSACCLNCFNEVLNFYDLYGVGKASTATVNFAGIFTMKLG